MRGLNCICFVTSVFCAASLPAQSLGNCATKVVVGSATTAAGDGGPATSAEFYEPGGVARDKSGNLYVADSFNHKLREVLADGTVRTIAGTGVPGGAGDSGPAAQAQLNTPVAVAIGPQGEVFVAEREGNRIRKIATDGTIGTVAGNGHAGFSGDGGPATQARLNWPTALAFDAQGNLYVADRNNARVRRIAADGMKRPRESPSRLTELCI